MNLDKIIDKVNSEEYKFLKEDSNLGGRLAIITLGGSHAYGTSVEGSDLDVRGCTLDSKEGVLTGEYFSQFEDRGTDTVIYGFNKLVGLLVACNPNTIEMLGNREDHYLYVSNVGKELLENRKMFLSRRAADSFGGYASAQLRRLDNKAARDVDWVARERHILNSIEGAKNTFSEKYFEFDDDSINLYVGESGREEYETEILMDVRLTGYPLRDYKCMWSEMNNIVKDYDKIGKRNKNAVEHNKLGKHMMHLVRLYYMCFDILEKGEIVTYREKEHDMLMEIRDGKYLDGSRPRSEFYEMVDELDKRLAYDKENTGLPDKADMGKVKEFVMSVNERIVKGEV